MSDILEWLGHEWEPSSCKHLNARIHGSDPVGVAKCPDCGKRIHISELFNNWLDRLRELDQHNRRTTT